MEIVSEGLGRVNLLKAREGRVLVCWIHSVTKDLEIFAVLVFLLVPTIISEEIIELGNYWLGQPLNAFHEDRRNPDRVLYAELDDLEDGYICAALSLKLIPCPEEAFVAGFLG